MVANHPLGDTSWIDTGWGALPDGDYRYIVQAVYTNNNLSVPVFSNRLGIGTTADVIVSVYSQGGSSVAGAVVRLVNNDGNPDHVYQQVATDKFVTFTNVWFGTYTLTITLPNHIPYSNTSLSVSENVVEYTATLLVLAVLLNESFDGTTFPPTGWTTMSHDPSTPPGGVTKGWQRHTGMIEPPNYNCPPHTPPAMAGSRSWYAGNEGFHVDQWFVTPQIVIPNNVKDVTLNYFVRAASQQYRCHYEVLISTTNTNVGVAVNQHAPIGNPGTVIGSWTSIYRHLPRGDMWIEKTHDLTQFAGNSIYIAFRHKDNSGDGEWAFIDTVTLTYSLPPISDDDIVAVPIVTALRGNHPNPFNPSTMIQFDLAQEGHVLIEVFNIRGQRVQTLVDAQLGKGSHQIEWNGTNLHGRAMGSGIYFYRMSTDTYTSTKRMILMK
jgi:hypothetical protein